MQPIEGITPDMLWTFLLVLIGLGGLVVLGDKVADVWRKSQERKRLGQSGPQNALAEEISRRVMASLEPRFEEIDRKLANDKVRLDEHGQKLSSLGTKNDTIETGQKALCRGVLALLSHEINGNSDDKLREAQTDINNYLIDK